ESQSVPGSPVFGHLNLIYVRFPTAGKLFGRQDDLRSRYAQVDDEGPIAAQPLRFLHRREQVFDAKVPDFPGYWCIYRLSHIYCFSLGGPGSQDIGEASRMKA